MKFLQKRFINFLVRRLFNLIDVDDLLTINENGQVTYKGRVLDPETLEQIKSDAITFENSIIWKILMSEVHYVAQQRINESTHDYQMVGPKAVFFVEDVARKKLEQLKNL